MFTFTKKADYGLAFLTVLSKKGKGGRVDLKEISSLGMPRAFVAKIASSLVEAGIINSKEGKRGGYSLNYEPREIMVKEALEAVEGEVEVAACGACPASDECGQRGFMDRLTGDINRVLERYTLADLIK